MTHPTVSILIFPMQHGADPCWLQSPASCPKCNPWNDDKILFSLLRTCGIKYRAEQPYSANHLQTMLITSSLHVSLCGFSLGLLCLLSTECENMQRVQHTWLFRSTFYTNNPWREAINCQFRERWESVVTVHFLPQTYRHSLRPNPVHCDKWITHDCRSTSRGHVGMPAAGAGRSVLNKPGLKIKIAAAIIEILTISDAAQLKSMKKKTAYVAIAPLFLCTWQQHCALWGGRLTLERSWKACAVVLSVTSGFLKWILPGKSSKMEPVSSLYTSNSPIASDSSRHRLDQARDVFQALPLHHRGHERGRDAGSSL